MCFRRPWICLPDRAVGGVGSEVGKVKDTVPVHADGRVAEGPEPPTELGYEPAFQVWLPSFDTE
jgi:hypothetical protein